jgi:hypothetical protein
MGRANGAVSMSTDLGDIGRLFPAVVPIACVGAFTLDKQPTPVTATISDAPAGAHVLLFTVLGTAVDRVNATSAGVAKFYDLDDGSYTAVDVNGNEWSVVVVGSVATVTRTFTSSRAQAVAFG